MSIENIKLTMAEGKVNHIFNHKKEEVQLETLKDLQGKPYKFYRGGNLDFSKGRFFCSCFDIARSYGGCDEAPVIETEIAVGTPLVIDATTKDGYSSYNYLYVRDCNLYPEEKRKGLIEHIKTVGGRDTLSTDEVLEWANGIKDIDTVIIKNVREGNNNKLPIYDVMIWSKKNLENARNVASEEQKFEDFRKNTYKRVDLSKYIPEKAQDGIISVTEGAGYIVENTIQKCKTNWYMGHELVVNTIVPVDIYCCEAQKYITANLLEPGIYQNTAWMTPRIKLEPNNGIVRVKGIMPNLRYQIES